MISGHFKKAFPLSIARPLDFVSMCIMAARLDKTESNTLNTVSKT